ncbi:MAG: hypothetical protein KF841_09220 [Phycisphaerae bacterium]|nr:hypothetical protein [Phycisphaerae bacterium]
MSIHANRPFSTSSRLGPVLIAALLFAASAIMIDRALADDPQDQPSSAPASETGSSAKKPPTTKPASGADPEPRREPSATEILRQLQEASRRDAKAVVRPGVEGERPRPIDTPPGNAISPPESKLLPDGTRLVDRPGRMSREGEQWVYSFESRGQGAPERPIRLLPNRLLEDMEMYSENGTKPVVFIVSGEITEYRGVNFLLVQKLLVRPETGNLK